MKHFHGVLAGNVHECSLKSRIGRVSMLPFQKTVQELINTLPQGAVFLCHAEENTRQRKLLERVEETFREQGHLVKNMSMGEVYKNSLNF